MFCSAPIAGPREARFSGKLEARDLVAQKRPPTELPHIGPFLARTPTGNCDTFLPPADRVP